MISIYYLLKGQTDKRLLRLFAVGCCKHIWHLLTDPKSKTAVEVAERFADGQATQKELKEARVAVRNAANEAALATIRNAANEAALATVRNAALATAHDAAYWAAHDAAYFASHDSVYGAVYATANDAAYGAVHAAAIKRQLELYNCIFTKIVFTTTSPNARNLAKLIYLERNWPIMPILGDALEELGAITEVVSHCKEKEHARGCWVVDNLLGHRK